MTIEDSQSQAFTEKVLAFLEERFPWLGKEDDEQISGADAVDELADLHRCLTEKHSEARRKSQGTGE
jgi:hypothetical protein